MPSIAIVTTCKGRLHHLRETLPRFVALGVSEIIVVDYGCPDGSGDWAEARFPGVKVVRASDDPGFCLGRARNLGAAEASADWLAFLDADTLVAEGWHAWMQAHLSPGHFYRRGLMREVRDAETHGVVVASRDDFLRVEGYDELYRGWGGEDEDLYQRLAVAGVAEREFDSGLIRAISHGDEDRAGWEGLRSRRDMIDLCACYRMAKVNTLQLLHRTGELPLDLRRQLLANTRQSLEPWFDSGRKTAHVMRYDVELDGDHIWFTIELPAGPA